MTPFLFPRGFSLVEVLVGLGMASGLALVVAQVNSQGALGAKAAALAQDLETVKYTIRTRIDCRKSLNVTPGSALPKACSGPVILRDKAGNRIAPGNYLGQWRVTARCNGGRVRVGARKNGKDPLTKKAWSAMPTATDLFNGTSDFCREYLDPGYAGCAAPYDVYRGHSDQGAKCCRRATKIETTLPYRAVLQCNPTEYLVTGGGSCHQLETGFVQAGTYERYFHTNFGDLHAGTWTVDCDEADPAGDVSDDVWAFAFAICCPK